MFLTRFHRCYLITARKFSFIVLCLLGCIKTSYSQRRLLVHRRVVIGLLYVVALLLVIPPNLLRNVRYCLLYPHRNVTAVLFSSMKRANTDRIIQAEKHFSSLNSSGVEDDRVPDGAVTVAITVITVSRNQHKIDNYEPKYLTQTVSKFLSLLDKWRPLNRSLQIRLSVCNVDDDVESYVEAIALAKFVPMFSRFNQSHVSSVHILEKEKQDYVFCLNGSLEIHPEADYVFLVEDDALPMDGLFDLLEHVLKQHVEWSYVRGEFHPRSSNIAYVKFFHPEWLLDFISFQPERLPELVSYAALLSTVAITVVYIIAVAGLSIGVDYLWIKAFAWSLILALAYGRVGISEWRGLALPYFYS